MRFVNETEREFEVEQVAVGFTNESAYGLESIINKRLGLGWYVFKLKTFYCNDCGAVRISGVVIFEREVREASHP